jgi:predicted ester cyclase
MHDQIERIYRAINDQKLDDLDEVFSDAYVDHAEGHRGVEPFKQQMRLFRTAFPDLRVTIEDTVESGDRIATRTTVTGTHTGDLMGIPPTNRHVSVSAVDIARFVDGKAVERWGGLDTFSLMVQLGVIPVPQPA